MLFISLVAESAFPFTAAPLRRFSVSAFPLSISRPVSPFCSKSSFFSRISRIFLAPSFSAAISASMSLTLLVSLRSSSFAASSRSFFDFENLSSDVAPDSMAFSCEICFCSASTSSEASLIPRSLASSLSLPISPSAVPSFSYAVESAPAILSWYSHSPFKFLTVEAIFIRDVFISFAAAVTALPASFAFLNAPISCQTTATAPMIPKNLPKNVLTRNENAFPIPLRARLIPLVATLNPATTPLGILALPINGMA